MYKKLNIRSIFTIALEMHMNHSLFRKKMILQYLKSIKCSERPAQTLNLEIQEVFSDN